jgi:multidrug efflux pump subunit AcrB
VGIALATLAASLTLIPFIGTEMLPPMDQGGSQSRWKPSGGPALRTWRGSQSVLRPSLPNIPT